MHVLPQPEITVRIKQVAPAQQEMGEPGKREASSTEQSEEEEEGNTGSNLPGSPQKR